MESEPVQPFRNRHLFIIPVCQTRRRFYGSNEVKPRSVSKKRKFSVEYAGDHRFIQRLTLLRNREHTSPGEESRAGAKTHSEHNGFVLPQLECILGNQDPRSSNSAQTVEDRATSATGIINSLTGSGCLVLSQQPDGGQQGNTYCVDMRDGLWTQIPEVIYDEAVFWKPPKQEATVLRIGARVTVHYRSEGDRRIATSITEEPPVERPWSQKPPTEWAMQEVIRTFVDSPWVHDVKFGASAASPMTGDFGPGGVGPGGIPRNQQETHDDAVRARAGLPPRKTPIQGPQPQSVGWTYGVTLRWLSSETLRTTLMRYWVLRGQPKQAAPMLAHDYAIGLKGPGAGSLSQIYLSSQKGALSHTPYLEFLPSKQKVFIRGVELVKQGALAPITDYVLYFPRTAEDGREPGSGAEKARLFCEYEIGKRVLPIKVEFDLRKMVRDGKPDL